MKTDGKALRMIVIAVLFFAGRSSAEEKVTDNSTAPDFKHAVVLFQDNPDLGEYKMVIRKTGSDEEPLYSEPAGGYADFSSATAPSNFRCLWSPDSRFVAVFERGTKRSGETSLYFLNGENHDKVQKLAFPDVMPLIKPYLKAKIRALYVRPEVWIQDHQLILSVIVAQLSDEHGGYRFILTLKMPKADAAKPTIKVVSFFEDRSYE